MLASSMPERKRTKSAIPPPIILAWLERFEFQNSERSECMRRIELLHLVLPMKLNCDYVYTRT